MSCGRCSPGEASSERMLKRSQLCVESHSDPRYTHTNIMGLGTHISIYI